MSENDNRIVSNYAKALIEISNSNASEVLSELQAIKKVLDTNQKLVQLLDDVSVIKKQQDRFIDALSDGSTNVVSNFLHTLADNRHFSLFNSIVEQLQDLIDARQNKSIVTAKTVVPLDKKQTEKIALIAKKTFGLGQVTVKNIIDPTIVGGVVLTSGSKTIDGSLKTKLGQLNRHIKNAVGKE
ncbi:ATP synthase F1 subunit delta [Oenococcus alcoholitolerans]|uniref:ATP synthase F1 subunit delta n=1 Tax=Oenococcus alcoholitolerans TaxID=931074 RepID=UPI003F6EFCF6